MADDICGTCTMCCKNLGIGDVLGGEPFRKPAGTWCPHCVIGKGCAIYADRPRTCREFQCLYHEGITRGEPSCVPDLRPDRCGVVLSGTTDGQLVASLDKHKPDAWRREPVYSMLLTWVRNGGRVTLSPGPTLRKLIMVQRFGDVVLEEASFEPPDEHGMQFSIPGRTRFIEKLQ